MEQEWKKLKRFHFQFQAIKHFSPEIPLHSIAENVLQLFYLKCALDLHAPSNQHKKYKHRGKFIRLQFLTKSYFNYILFSIFGK